MSRQVLLNLSSVEYEHPKDKFALEKLRKIPILPQLIELAAAPQSSITRFKHSASYVRLNERQLPSVYRLLREACEILSVDEPTVYLGTQGDRLSDVKCEDKPIIYLTSQLVDTFSEDELMFVLGHELAHIKSRHLVYKTLASLVSAGILEKILALIPGSGLVSGGLSTALNVALVEWYQSGELTCDRGGYLACQNFTASCTALMKLAGWSEKYVNEMNLEEFMAQAREYEDLDSDAFDTTKKIMLSMEKSTHPFAVSRISQLLEFDKNGLYSDILQRKTEVTSSESSQEPSKPDEPPVPVGKATKDAVDSLKKLGGSMFSKFKQ